LVDLVKTIDWTQIDWTSIDWMNASAGGLAIVILLGGMLMMFTGIFTTKR